MPQAIPELTGLLTACGVGDVLIRLFFFCAQFLRNYKTPDGNLASAVRRVRYEDDIRIFFV